MYFSFKNKISLFESRASKTLFLPDNTSLAKSEIKNDYERI
jgi:hypothetical protein